MNKNEKTKKVGRPKGCTKVTSGVSFDPDLFAFAKKKSKETFQGFSGYINHLIFLDKVNNFQAK